MKISLTNNQMEEFDDISREYPYIFLPITTNRSSTRWHWHDELEFGFLIEGELDVSTTTRTYHFSKGEGYFMNSNVLAAMEYPGKAIADYHLFHATFLSGHFRSVFETKYINPVLHNKKIEVIELRGTTENQKKILAKLRQASTLQSQKDTEFQLRNIFSEIWLLLLEEIRQMDNISAPVSTIMQERLLSMLSFIQENYPHKITLEEIASTASISTRECLRCFQNNIHETPFEYLMNYRVEMAKKLLKATNLSVTEIAMQTGFSNSAYFSKIFKRTCHMTPLAYRKEVQET